MKDRFGANNSKALMCRFHTQTGGSTLTATQIDNNVIRTTIQALSAVFGGTQSLHTNSKDEALALPTDDAVKLALRTQQIIAFESGIAKYPDPFAGSYVVEELTDQLESEATKLIEKIDSMGGAVTAIERGWIQNEIARSAYRFQRGVDDGRQIIVGVNKFSSEKEEETHLLEIDHEAIENQKKRVKIFKANRNGIHIQNRLTELENAAVGQENLIPFIIECVKQKCTLGEISDALRVVFGEYHPTH